MPKKACIDTTKISDTTKAKDIRAKAGISATCTADSKCGICFKVSEGNAEEMKK